MKKVCLRIVLLALLAAAMPLVLEAQDEQPSRVVDTTTRPIEKQSKGLSPFDDDGVCFSNDFDGARMNRVEKTGTDKYTITITPENAPINMSPWYAFQVWAKKKKTIAVRLVYPEFARHRYNPQISENGRKWRLLDSSMITQEDKGTGSAGAAAMPKSIVMTLKVGKKPLWVSAQELHSSRQVYEWIAKTARRQKAVIEDIGKSREGRPLRMFRFGARDAKNMMIVISRQHPPEVTGYFAMQAFVEKMMDGSRLSKDFRKIWSVCVIPLMNPDGVDAGHWRHNAGGVDLNRDWTTFNQPEGKAVSDFLLRRERETGGKFYFGIDFHSTWNDIYYPMVPELSGNMPNLVQDWLTSIKKAIPGYEPNIQPNRRLRPAIISRNYFLASHGMEAIVFEIGDNTPRDFIRKKGRVGAEELMKLMIERKRKPAAAARTAVYRSPVAGLPAFGVSR